MKELEIYSELGLKNEDEVFNYLISTLKTSNRTFDYFVDWERVFGNINDIEIQLNILNYLVGKDDIEYELTNLIKKYPEVVNVIPILLAIREKKLEVLIDYKTKKWEYKEYSFYKKNRYNDEEIKDIVEFCSKSRLLNLLKDEKIKNLVDYCIGLEVGIGTNGRKNRSGTIMESILDWNLKNTCGKLGLDYISQATKKSVKLKWDIDLPTDKSDRIHDFIIKKGRQLIVVETNFYSGGGTKLKSTAGEFETLNDFFIGKKEIDKFIWITDGRGWHTAKSPLREAFNTLDYIFNINMIAEGVLEEAILR